MIKAAVAAYEDRVVAKIAKAISPEHYAASGTEHGQQVALFMWASPTGEGGKWYPQLRLMHAIPNGGLRDKITAGRLKAEGVKRGIPDIFLPWPVNGWHGLYIEMKRPTTRTDGKARRRHGLTSEEQDTIRADLMWAGYGVATAYSYEEAKEIIVAYLTWKPTC